MRTRYDANGVYRGEDPVAAMGAISRVARNGMPKDYDPFWDAEHPYNSPHLSGNMAGTANTDIYVPGNYQGQPTRPSPTGGVVLINYPQLGNLSNVTLAIYHVGNFGVQRMSDGRVRIGTTGGPGGNDAGNFHSHFEIWTVTHNYDALGRRIQRSSNSGTTTKFVYDGADVVRDLDTNGSAIADYVNGPDIDNKLRQTGGGTVSYFLTDHIGTTRALTDVSGNNTSSLTYDSFGNVTSGSASTRYTYTGRELDPETGLMYYRARWYDPAGAVHIDDWLQKNITWPGLPKSH